MKVNVTVHCSQVSCMKGPGQLCMSQVSEEAVRQAGPNNTKLHAGPSNLQQNHHRMQTRYWHTTTCWQEGIQLQTKQGFFTASFRVLWKRPLWLDTSAQHYFVKDIHIPSKIRVQFLPRKSTLNQVSSSSLQSSFLVSFQVFLFLFLFCTVEIKMALSRASVIA